MASNIIQFPLRAANDNPEAPSTPPSQTGLVRTPELLMAISIIKHLPTEIREKVKSTIELTATAVGDDVSRAAAVAVASLR